jgi:hypothetical protein
LNNRDHEWGAYLRSLHMKNKLIGTLVVASLGAAMTLATPAMAQRGQDGERGMHAGGGGGGGARAGAAPSARGGMMATPGARAGASNMRRDPGMRFSGNNSFRGRNAAEGGRQWSGHRWTGRHHRDNRWGYGAAGFGLGFALGAAPYYYYDDYYGPYAYGYDDGYDDYAAGPAYSTSDAAVQYCIERFRSYDIASQTYLGYDGQRHSCP